MKTQSGVARGTGRGEPSGLLNTSKQMSSIAPPAETRVLLSGVSSPRLPTVIEKLTATPRKEARMVTLPATPKPKLARAMPAASDGEGAPLVPRGDPGAATTSQVSGTFGTGVPFASITRTSRVTPSPSTTLWVPGETGTSRNPS